MTLITYLSRVHFADGVLEVALSSELELNKRSRPLLVYEPDVVSNEFSERVIAGLPGCCKFSTHGISANLSAQRVKTALAKSIRDTNSDSVIAFGSARALTLADACCRCPVSSDPLPAHATASDAPAGNKDLFAIPGVDGLPAMSMRRNDNGRTGGYGAGIQPTTVIIDPTLIVGESVDRTASAIANALARCLSEYFSESFNPPATGIAMEGFNRIRRNLPSLVTEDTLDMRRELMAASLNGTLATLKETGIAHELGEILLRDSSRSVDKGALMRLLITVEAELLERYWTKERNNEIRDAFNVPAGTGLRDWLVSIMELLPLPGSFTELGFGSNQLAAAAKELSVSKPAIVPSTQILSKMLASVEFNDCRMLAVSD